MGIRQRVLFVSFAAIVTAALVGGVFLERVLRGRLEGSIEENLEHLALAMREVVRIAPEEDLASLADDLADRIGEASGARVTIIRGDGRVLGDSLLEGPALASVENHAGRPEVRSALSGDRGVARRHSTTIGTDMIYVAVPYDRPGDRGVVRAAMALDDVDEAVSGLRLALLLAGLLAVGLALGVTLLASHAASRSLRELVSHARAMAHGERGIALGPEEDLGGLAGSFRKMAEELDATVAALAKERDRLETILEGMGDGVLALDGEGRITLLNRAAVDLLALAEAPTGRRLVDVVPAPALEELLEPGAEGSSVAVEFAVPAAPHRSVLARAAPLRSSEGTVVVLHDNTDVRRVEAMRRDFVANVSHELRTPVSVIRANTETVLDSAIDDPASARRFLEAVLRNAERLSRLISDLLDLSRIEAGEHALDLDSTPLRPVVRRALEALEAPIAQKPLTPAADVDDDVEVVADPRALEQVLLNLLENAVKYTPAGGHVTVSAEPRGSMVRIEVRDDGPGVKPKHRQRVFERFYRADPGRSREMGGTGLGLSIAKHLVEAMGGKIGVEPALPTGSIFWFTLPTG